MRCRTLLLLAAAALLAGSSCAGGREAERRPVPAPGVPAAEEPPAPRAPADGAGTDAPAAGGAAKGAPAKGAPPGKAGAPPRTGPLVAVAPLENRSNDLDAADVVRSSFVEGIARRGWNVMATEESDRLLREKLGINYGGQLKTTDPAEVCRALGVEGVFYGDVLEWNKTTAGFYNAVTVEAAFELFGKDGRRRWGDGERRVKQDMPRGGGSGSSLLGEIVMKAVGSLVLTPMTPHGAEVGKRIAAKVPPGALSLPPQPAPAEKEGKR